MTTKVIHIRNKTGANNEVYIGRPSKWGNPFAIGPDGDREDVIEKFETYITIGAGKHLLKDLHELKNKTLVCYCKPKDCHGDILAKLADAI